MNINIPQKIVLVQLFSNGDCLYATAVARQIKADYPGCHLTWAIADFCKSIISGNPFVDDIMIVTDVTKNDEPAFKKFKKELLNRKDKGEFDEVIITHIMGSNQANYDGCIRSAIFRGYHKSITVPVTPVLRLSIEEKEKANLFAQQHELNKYSQVILFEFAPQSGQSKITKDFAIELAENLTLQKNVAVILSSANKINSINKQVIDGSGLSIRETAALTHYCTFLLGCSSGITWLSTSDAAKQLPMVQLLNPETNWANPLSRDFERFGLTSYQLIELIHFDKAKILDCIKIAMEDFKLARKRYHQKIPLHFRTTRSIVYNLLCYLQFAAIFKHIKINRKVYGNNFSFYKEVILGFIIAPFKLVKNFFTKKL